MPLADPPPMALRLVSCPSCGKDIEIYLPVAAVPPDLLDALAHWHARLEQAVWLRRDGHLHAGLSLALTETAFFLLAGWEQEPSADDLEVLALFRDPALMFDEEGRGIVSSRIRPARKGGGRRLTDAAICYRGWVAQASLAQINAGRDPGDADIEVAAATHWAIRDPAIRRLGGTLSRKAVCNMRLRATKNLRDDPIARFVRGLPPIQAARGTEEAKTEAGWFLAQIASREGQAFVAV